MNRDYTLPSPVYDVLKYVTQIVLPALGTLYFALAGIWGLPAAEAVSGTILAVVTFLGVCLGISSRSYHADEENYIPDHDDEEYEPEHRLDKEIEEH